MSYFWMGVLVVALLGAVAGGLAAFVVVKVKLRGLNVQQAPQPGFQQPGFQQHPQQFQQQYPPQQGYPQQPPQQGYGQPPYPPQ
ncbi:hypothetical protein SAMN05421805_108129 [Saccharopolyspora antimicrobica]|uniref:Uncharacterized protein n=1 Tax=Saccharopolyspora antimicrobica TaxID=455193 RepID=A0A1I5DGI8_9PSEU|nr:hypothetical protein [Saccharopolyspora antimicrobica]RKT85125.1 hypothetical protein ATL45_3461 [Saccharopolyspora antimicrobica]SFN98276.1 hypothetical protein SAMN05421805_108129 [Saccharopolyspora antimicrobica]